MATMQALLLTLATLGQGDETVLLDFTATWCGPCQQVAPLVHQLAAKGYPIRQVDIDQNRALAQKYRVSSIPCFVMLVNGQEVARQLGPQSQGQLLRMLALAKTAAAKSPPAVTSSLASNRGGGATFAGQSPDDLDPFTRARGSAPAATAPNSQIPNNQLRGQGAPYAGATTRNAPLDQQLLAATVRIKVEDPDGHSYGTGTIIHQTQGKALILTCAHLFRDSKGRGTISLDMFDREKKHGVPAAVLDYDLERDIALLVMETATPVQVAPVGLANYPAKVGQPIFSVGCGGGDDPTVWSGQVTSVNKYLGPPNIQASGEPVQGRSGGGLFDNQGRLIGVCNAADPTDHEGLYAALGTIHELLQKHDLTYVASMNGITPATNESVASASLASAAASDASATPQMDEQAPGNPFSAGTNSVASSGTFSFPGVVTGVARDHTEASETNFQSESFASNHDDAAAEIICLIRSKDNPAGEPKVVVISDASPEVLEWLARQGTPVNREPQLTAQKVQTAQRPRLWEPVLRVRDEFAPGPNAPSNSRARQAAPGQQSPPQSSAVTPDPRDIPWRPAHVSNQ